MGINKDIAKELSKFTKMSREDIASFFKLR